MNGKDLEIDIGLNQKMSPHLAVSKLFVSFLAAFCPIHRTPPQQMLQQN